MNHPPKAIPTDLDITLEIGCMPLTIKSKMPTKPIFIYYINSGMPFEFIFIDFDTQPKCMTSPTNILYEFHSSTVNKRLPKELTLNPEEKRFTIDSDQQ